MQLIGFFRRIFRREHVDTRSHLHEDPRRTTPIGLIRFADDFFQAAIDADSGIGQEDGFELHAPIPVLHLTAHAIELALKSYLVHQGVSLRAVRLKYGHDLEKAFRKAVTLGLLDHVDFSSEEVEVMKVLNRLHITRELEYIVAGVKTVPIFGPLSTFADKLITAVSAQVGFRHFRNRGFVHGR